MPRPFHPLPPAAVQSRISNAPFRYAVATVIVILVCLSPFVKPSGDAPVPHGARTTPALVQITRHPQGAERLSGPVSHVRDGDTIEVAGVPIRFTDMDCAERGTPAGDLATQALRAEVTGRQVNCDLTGEMSFDRNLGVCTMANGLTIRNLMLRAGHCADRPDRAVSASLPHSATKVNRPRP